MPMTGRVRSFTLTMNGATQPLSDAFAAADRDMDDVSCQEIHLHNPSGGSAVLLGGPTMTGSTFGISLAAGATQSFECGVTRLKPSDFYVRGTGLLHVLLLTN